MVQKIAMIYSKKPGYITLFISPQGFLSPFFFDPKDIDITSCEKLAVIDLYEENNELPVERIMYCSSTTLLDISVNNVYRLRHPTEYLIKDVPLQELTGAEQAVFEKLFIHKQKSIRGSVIVSKRRGRLIKEDIIICNPEDLVI